MIKKGIVYCLKLNNIVIYVGSTCDIKKRMNKHRSDFLLQKKNTYRKMKSLTDNFDNIKVVKKKTITYTNDTRYLLLRKEQQTYIEFKKTCINKIAAYNPTRHEYFKNYRKNLILCFD